LAALLEELRRVLEDTCSHPEFTASVIA